jgi:hypothetical protein
LQKNNELKRIFKLFYFLKLTHIINLLIPIIGPKAGKKILTIVIAHCIIIFVGINFQIRFDVDPNPIKPIIILIIFPIKLANNLGILFAADFALFFIRSHKLF